MRWIGITALGALLCLSAPAKADIAISISKSQQQMTVTIDGAPTYRWAVSTGRSGYDTPSGSFPRHPARAVYYSKKFDDAPMPNSVFFYGGYAIHGTYEEAKLGNPVSHGCVRLARANAETLFALVRARGMSNTRIVITDGPMRERSEPAPMARLRGPDRDYGFEQFRPAPRRVVVQETRQTRGDDSSRDAWLRSLDRKYGISTR